MIRQKLGVTLLFPIALFLGRAPVQAQVPDSVILRLMEDHSVPGLALAVVRGDSTSLYGWGQASEDPTDLVTPDTPFRIASVAKSLVAATVVTQAVERGIDLNADVEPLIGFRLNGPYSEPVTLHHLLTHTGGFDERMVGYAARTSGDMKPLSEYLPERMPERGWPAGAVVAYSNHGMSLAAYVVERAAGTTFGMVASASLFAGLGMTATRFIEAGEEIPPDATPALSCDEGACSAREHLFSHTYPAGLAFSTARDMAAFIGAVLEAQEEGGPLAELIPERFSHDARIPGISYGLFNQGFGPHRIVAHSGSAGGYWALLAMVPEESVGFFFAANGGSSQVGGILRDELLGELLGPQSAPEVRASRTEDPSIRAGTYELTRYSHTTIERLPQLFYNSIRLLARGDSLIVYSGGRREAFVQVDDSLYQGVGGGTLMAFGTREGKEYLFRASDVYGARLPAAYERRSPLTASRFVNEYVSWLMGLPLIFLVLVWPCVAGLSAYRRRRRSQEPAPTRGRQVIATLMALAASLLFTWFGFGFTARSNRLLESGELLYGMTKELTGLLWIPYAHILLTGFLLLALPYAWKQGWWGLPRRLLFSLLIPAVVLQAAFFFQWNYLPATW
jgi:CubicO group peptidase (beta-lactamase class C family)